MSSSARPRRQPRSATSRRAAAVRGTRPRTRGRTARTAARRRPRIWRYRRVLLLLMFLTVVGLGGFLFVLSQIPLPPAAPQAQTSFLTDVHGARLASLDAGENRVPVRLSEVPAVVKDAVLAVEDRNFYDHRGLDPLSIARATWADIRGKGALQGGSTITQQYAKNTYVGRERSLSRKLKEAVVAVKLEREFDKDEILERYLNAIYLGRGAYGVQAASRAYFAKDVRDLGLAEAAYLAGLIRAPEKADATRHPEEAALRRTRALGAMRRAGMVGAAEMKVVEDQPLDSYVIDRQKTEPRVAHAEDGTQHFVEYVRHQLVKRFGEAAVFGGGLRVKTTLDLKMQAAAYDAAYGLLDKAEDPAAALVAVDDTGAIRAMVGGRDFGASKVNLAVGREGGGRGRQAGSTFKPFLLAETVRQGYTVESAFPGPPQVVLAKANNGKDWPVENYDRHDYGPSVNLIDATRNSVNTVYAQLMMEIGPDDMADMAQDLGISSPLDPVNSLVLGTSDVSPLEMARAYSTFANRGERADSYALLEVTTADGQVLERAKPTRTRVLPREDADVVTFCLRQAVERGTGTAARFGKPLAGKTGTTSDWADAWFVGYTPKLTAAVWMGYPESNAHKMTNVRGKRVTGGSFPAQIFKRFMTAATKGRDTGTFANVRDFGGKVVGTGVVDFSSTTSSSSSSTTGIPATTIWGTTSTTYRDVGSSSTTSSTYGTTTSTSTTRPTSTTRSSTTTTTGGKSGPGDGPDP